MVQECIQTARKRQRSSSILHERIERSSKTLVRSSCVHNAFASYVKSLNRSLYVLHERKGVRDALASVLKERMTNAYMCSSCVLRVFMCPGRTFLLIAVKVPR